MKFPGVLFLVIAGTLYMNGSLFAQQSPAERVHLIAVMVEFQPDENRFTSGNGTFESGSIPYLESPGTRIDALPHDRAYFEAHLEFSKRYFERQANGHVTLSYQVLPQTVRLPNEMAFYSPVGENPNNTPLAVLARDVWSEVGKQQELVHLISTALQLNDQVGFVLFHAGIGRDLELTGTVLEKTPQDIPSVYLNQNSFAELLADPAFQGFDLGNGVYITNSMIVPRTESRVGQDISGQDFVIGLSVNGMLTAQIGSFLGLPDLFQTQSGESGIGRFGLMDGAGIFAMNGLFPPELSAWEKVWLGWEEPHVMDPSLLKDGDEIILNIPAAALREKHAVIKIPVTDSEYFLIENRHRDPEGEGSLWTFQTPDGSTETLRVTNLDSDILAMSLGIDSVFPKGVLIDVSNYDFALHGGADTGSEIREPTINDRQLNGGILIWHVDEAVIQSAMRSPGNGVNDNPGHRGVDLEEADGAQDIGFATSLGFSSVDPTGSAFDFWWKGNDARVITQTGEIQLYQNRFDARSTPNNRTYGGGQSWFSLSQFSENLPVAKVTLRSEPSVASHDRIKVDIQKQLTARLDDQFGGKIAGAPDIWLSTPALFSSKKLNPVDGQESVGEFLFLAGQEALWGIQIGADQQTLNSEPVIVDQGGAGSILQAGHRMIVSFPAENRIASFVFDSGTNSFQKEWESVVTATGRSLRNPTPDRLTADFANWTLDLNNGSLVSSTDIVDLQTPEHFGVSATISEDLLKVSIEGNATSLSLPASYVEAFTQEARIELGIMEYESGTSAVYLAAGSHLYRIIPPFSIMDQVELTSQAAQIPSSFGDLNGDERMDILFVSEDLRTLHAMGIHGALLPNFPVQAPSGYRFAGAPLLVDVLDHSGSFSGDLASTASSNRPEVLIPIEKNGSITLTAYDSEGNPLPEFTISLGSYSEEQMSSNELSDALSDVQSALQSDALSDLQTVPGIYLDSERLATISGNGLLQLFTFSPAADVTWGNPLGEAPQVGLMAVLQGTEMPEETFSLLNMMEVYNWPNPAKDRTRIRYETSQEASLSIRVITPSGRKFFDKTLLTRGGAPEETELDVSSWPSGLYIVQVTASHNDRTERKQFNMAVIH